MPQAEILRIIDVKGEAKPSPDERANGAEAHAGPRDAMVTWKIGTENIAVALKRRKPTIVLEHPDIVNPTDARLVLMHDPASPQARSYRALRHRLLSVPDVHVVAVTSPRPGDGKTTCAANLALALAEDASLRVLLVDGNVVRPALARLFGFSPAESLVDRITRFADAAPPYPVATIRGTRVHVAALPEAPEQRRLERSLLGAALYELRSAYDYIVIDAGAVLESADADVVGECADSVVLVGRAWVSHKADFVGALEALAPAPILGTVLLDT